MDDELNTDTSSEVEEEELDSADLDEGEGEVIDSSLDDSDDTDEESF